MADSLAAIRARIEHLEDLDAIGSAVLAFETGRDGPPANADKLAQYLTPDIRFYWALEDIEIKGRRKLIEYLREGMTPRIWCRHNVTNLDITVKGKKATATWYVLSSSVSRPNLKRLRKGDLRARQMAPASGETIISSSGKGSKVATLVKGRDGWRFSDYRIDMTRVSVDHIKIQRETSAPIRP